jgi:hypothetical protein
LREIRFDESYPIFLSFNSFCSLWNVSWVYRSFKLITDQSEVLIFIQYIKLCQRDYIVNQWDEWLLQKSVPIERRESNCLQRFDPYLVCWNNNYKFNFADKNFYWYNLQKPDTIRYIILTKTRIEREDKQWYTNSIKQRMH